MRFIFLTSGLIALLCTTVHAQHSSETKKSSPNYSEKDLAGTYEIISEDSKQPEALTTDILPLIEKNRDEKEIRYLRISDRTVIKIYPKGRVSPASKPE